MELNKRSQSIKRDVDTQSVISWAGSVSASGVIPARARRSMASNLGQQRTLADLLARNANRDPNRQSQAGLSLYPDDATSWSGASQGAAEVLRPERRHWNSCFHHYRFVVAFLAGSASALMLFHRLNVAIAILPMVNQTHLYLEANPNKTLEDFLEEGLTPGGEFNWSNEIVAIILGWYMFSYTLPQIPMTRLNTIIGCRAAVPLGLVMSSVASLLTPAAAYWGWQWVVACRFLNGLGAAGIITGMLQLLEDWMRYDEISLGLTISSIVTTSMLAACPFIAGELAAYHWSLAFTIPSYFTLGFCLLWLFLVTNEPESNCLISKQELDFLLEEELEQAMEEANKEKPAKSVDDLQHNNNLEHDKHEHEPVAWTEIFKLPTFYAYLVIWALNCSCTVCYAYVLPAYMCEFLKIPISENGFYCFLIYSGGLLAVIWPHQALERFLKLGFSPTQVRLGSQFAGNLMMAITFALVGLFHQYQLPLLFLNRCFMSSDVIVISSIMANFAKAGLSSTAYAMINTVGNLSITASSPLIGWWLDYSGPSTWTWSVIFWGFSLGQVMMFLIFALFIDSEPIEFRRESKADVEENATKTKH